MPVNSLSSVLWSTAWAKSEHFRFPPTFRFFWFLSKDEMSGNSYQISPVFIPRSATDMLVGEATKQNENAGAAVKRGWSWSLAPPPLHLTLLLGFHVPRRCFFISAEKLRNSIKTDYFFWVIIKDVSWCLG